MLHGSRMGVVFLHIRVVVAAVTAAAAAAAVAVFAEAHEARRATLACQSLMRHLPVFRGGRQPRWKLSYPCRGRRARNPRRYGCSSRRFRRRGARQNSVSCGGGRLDRPNLSSFSSRRVHRC